MFAKFNVSNLLLQDNIGEHSKYIYVHFTFSLQSNLTKQVWHWEEIKAACFIYSHSGRWVYSTSLSSNTCYSNVCYCQAIVLSPIIHIIVLYYMFKTFPSHICLFATDCFMGHLVQIIRQYKTGSDLNKKQSTSKIKDTLPSISTYSRFSSGEKYEFDSILLSIFIWFFGTQIEVKR